MGYLVREVMMGKNVQGQEKKIKLIGVRNTIMRLGKNVS